MKLDFMRFANSFIKNGQFSLFFSIIALTFLDASDSLIQHRHIPNSYFYIEREGYILTYDSRNKNPHWVYEHLTKEKIQGDTKRLNFRFKEDASIPELFRIYPSDYFRTGFDRGHMACAANHKASPQLMGDTFFLSNIAPQIPIFNRGCWARLEARARELTNVYTDVYVVSGGIYMPYEDTDGKRYIKYQVIGEKNIAVPTHYFKILILEDECLVKCVEAYIIPHNELSQNVSLDKFKVDIESVQRLSGLQLN